LLAQSGARSRFWRAGAPQRPLSLPPSPEGRGPSGPVCDDTGGYSVPPGFSHKRFTFVACSGFFKPLHSHTCRTPWSVFQDGTIGTVLYWHLHVDLGSGGTSPPLALPARAREAAARDWPGEARGIRGEGGRRVRGGRTLPRRDALPPPSSPRPRVTPGSDVVGGGVFSGPPSRVPEAPIGCHDLISSVTPTTVDNSTAEWPPTLPEGRRGDFILPRRVSCRGN